MDERRMTADVELLPLPDDGPYYDPGDMQEYARACVAHATAAKDAEIEALRAELREMRRAMAGEFKRAERLAEALRSLVAGAEAEMDPAWECNSYHPALNRGVKLARAALHPTPTEAADREP